MGDADPIQRLTHAFTRLPGIGRKSAARLTYFVLNAEERVAMELAQALIDVKACIGYCSICCTLTEHDPCRLCRHTGRDDAVICVVESVPGLLAVERTGAFEGRYHVLHGVLSPLDGIGPAQLRIKELVSRFREGVDELIIATNPSVEGEATALYIHRLAAPFGIKTTRIASGVPMGSELEHADQLTLGRALRGRREI